MAKKSKDARFEGRCHDWEMKLIDEGADWVGESRSEFFVQAAVDRARGLIPDSEKRIQELRAEYFNPKRG